MNKYLGEDLLIPNSQNEKNSKIPMTLKNNVSNLQFRNIEIPNPEIKKTLDRVFFEFRFLNMDKIPNIYFKYNIPNNTPNNSNVKISKKLNSIVFDIEKRIERNKISIDMKGRKNVSFSMYKFYFLFY